MRQRGSYPLWLSLHAPSICLRITFPVDSAGIHGLQKQRCISGDEKPELWSPKRPWSPLIKDLLGIVVRLMLRAFKQPFIEAHRHRRLNRNLREVEVLRIDQVVPFALYHR
jgi:hypothetical protein